MTDRVPTPTLAGDLTPLAGVDYTIATLLATTTLVAASFNVLTAPPSSAATIEIRRSGVALATVTIAQGQRFGSWSGSVAVTAGDVLELRVTSAGGGASDLSGRLAFGADVTLTSVDRVKEYAGIQGTAVDALLLELVTSVSLAIEAWCGRPLILRAYANETHRPNGRSSELLLERYPVVSSPAPTFTLDGTALSASDYELDGDAGILRRVSSGVLTRWESGTVLLASYSAGYATIPADLRAAATKQARHELRQSGLGGDRLGDRSKALEVGGQTTYEPDGLLPSVIQVLELYREVRARGD